MQAQFRLGIGEVGFNIGVAGMRRMGFHLSLIHSLGALV